jgi:RHS repeat-associated protein
MSYRYNYICGFFIVLWSLAATLDVSAAEEPYVNELKGRQIDTNKTFSVTDEKFKSLTLWNKIQQNISVDNILTFEINYDTLYHFYNKPFTAEIQVTIQTYNNPQDTSQEMGPQQTITLTIHYDTTSGKPYKGIAMYKFKGAHKFKVTINSINGPLDAADKLLPIFRLKGQTIINRQYIFNDNTTDISIFENSNNKLTVSWNPAAYEGAEMYDFEYTHIDSASDIGWRIKNVYNNGLTSISADTLALWFHNNNTRVTTPASSYTLNLSFNSGFILYRIRGVQIHYDDNIRYEGNWNYFAKAGVSGTQQMAVAEVQWHERNLNWQYNATFAEEGKRKEVMSYFDGTLRNRQTVTINNSDNIAVAQESVFDPLGRPTVNILPAPINNNQLKYYPGLNVNNDGEPYSHTDITEGISCRTGAAEMKTTSGASQYYSAANPFTSFRLSRYIPDAEKFPFTVTEYTGDNTGRIRSQGGVGPAFQMGSTHETRYFYEKPTQTELDRLFGVEAGYAEHYLKNTVQDANGQLSVSYVSASGKTIATALAGPAPTNLEALPSNGEGAVVSQTNEMFGPTSFERNASDYRMFATASFVVKTSGIYKFDYRVDPYKLQTLYSNEDSVICSNCYYDVVIRIKNDCDSVLNETIRPSAFSFDTSCVYSDTIRGSIELNISKIGEYYVSYSLRVSEKALNYFDSTHFEKNTDIKRFNSFLQQSLLSTDFYGCFNDCETCIDELGTKDEFVDRFKTLYLTDSLIFTPQDSLVIGIIYDSLLVNCMNIQAGCDTSSGSPCDDALAILKMDVTPGGQYALYDSTTFDLLETPINALDNRNSVSFFTDEYGKRDSVLITQPDGEEILTDVKELTIEQFINNWKDVWADSLVRFHPEYCYYEWCVLNEASARFNEKIKEFDNADTVITLGWFNPANPYALLEHDPFFAVGGKGRTYYNRMQDSLRLFSRTAVRLSQSDKNILQFVDIVLYCNSLQNGWDACQVEDSCRSRNLEWELYKNLYLNLKSRFNEEVRRKSPGFEDCANCNVGKDPMPSALCTPPPITDFTIEQSVTTPSKYYIKYKDPVAGVSVTQVFVAVQYRNNCIPPDCEIPYTLDTLYRKFSFGSSIDSFTLTAQQSTPVLIQVRCDTAAASYTPFYPPTTCNTTCPGGIYKPYDRDSISYYIEYGNPLTPPTGTPANYTNCSFYAVFNVNTSATAGCQFFNVWVCTLDSACVFGNPVPVRCIIDSISVPSCPVNPNAELLKNKQRRYLDYSDPTNFINQMLSGNPGQGAQQNQQGIINECKSNCEASADYWITVLKGCTPSQDTLDLLKAAFIEICSSSCDGSSIFGASSVPASVSITYHTFEEAIIGILGAGAINQNCAVELLNDPYPHNKQPFRLHRSVAQTDYDICSKITAFKNKYTSSGYSGTFHQYLKLQLGLDYQLLEGDLNDLIKSCVSCNGILQDAVEIPLAFEPQAKPGISCSTAVAMRTAFRNKFPALDTASFEYSVMFTNYMNHQLGFSLEYATYKRFFDSCSQNAVYYTTLYNHVLNAADQDTTFGPDNSCIAQQYSTAFFNALTAYNYYADSVHRAFRTAYLEKCLGITPVLTLTSNLYEYHYTLYYYDQSGNLVKTVPPQGVVLLTAAQRDSVKTYRQLKLNNLTSPYAVLPAHTLVTTYSYNSLNQVITQQSPDGGKSDFFYDRLGRLVVSQNAKQLSGNKYSYTRYDELGRITEVGEMEHNTAITDLITKDTTAFANWYNNKTNRAQITFTVYDAANISLVTNSSITNEQFLGTSRKRVVGSFFKKGTITGNAAITNYDHATHYKYDINGNVQTLWQEDQQLAAIDGSNNGIRRINYEYDLVSGKVNKVIYQPGKGDQFLHKYQYDAENRLTAAYTSRDGWVWQQQANYNYYLHGPLARTELGHYKVQGLDYAYTLQGWMKGINSQFLDTAKDMGDDAHLFTNNPRSVISKDVMAFSIGYYNNDYKPIGGSNAPAFGLSYTAPGSLATGVELFNGNFSHTTLALSKINNGALTGYTYQYDQLNRIKKTNQHTGIAGNATTWSNSSIIQDYKEEVAYDANGNILTYLRNGTTAGGRPLAMDNLTYNYIAGTNKLAHVDDGVAAGNYTEDIDDQNTGNYQYDAIGNLTKDVKEGIDSISWTVYGKINSITKTGGTVIAYEYDAAGNRVQKKVTTGSTNIVTTYYVRDAQGNTMAVYEDSSSTGLKLEEQHIYGSSRLGMYTWGKAIPATAPVPQWLGGTNYSNVYDSILPGSISYELSNHLGNVLSVISDKKMGVPLNETVVKYFVAEVLSQNDYYPFGMGMPGRKFSGGYRYGFNGKENDNEVKGEGNQQDYGMRIYDTRLGRFLSVDPLTKDYPWYTPYQFAGNTPIWALDLDGGEPKSYIKDWKVQDLFAPKSGKQYGDMILVDDPKLGIVDVQQVYDKDTKQYWFVHKTSTGDWYYLNNDAGDHNILHTETSGKSPTKKLIGGSMEPFKTADRISYERTLNDRSFYYAISGRLLAPALVLGGVPTAITYGSEVLAASGWSRIISGGTNLTFQMIQNANTNENIWQNIKKINITSFGLSVLNPASTFTNSAAGNFGKASIEGRFKEAIGGEEFNFKNAAVGTFIDFAGNKLSNKIDFKLTTPSLGGFKPNQAQLLGNVLSNTVTTPVNVIANEATKKK